jgi:hypothetical protein
VSDLDVLFLQHLGKIPSELQAVVSLHHRKLKSKLALGSLDSASCQTRQDSVVYFGVGHSAVNIYDSVNITSFVCIWAYVMDCVSLNQLSRPGWMWSPGVVWSKPLLSGAIEAVMAPEYPAYAAEANSQAIDINQVVPHHFSTAFQLPAKSQDTLNNCFTDCIWRSSRRAAARSNAPPAHLQFLL